MNFKILILLVMTGLFVVLWLLVYFKGQNRIISKTFNIFVINMALWTFGLMMFYATPNLRVALFWTSVLYMAGSLIPVSFLLLSFVFPSGEFCISRFARFLIFVPNIVLFVLFFFTPIIVKEVVIINGVKWFIYGPGHVVWDIQFDIIFTWAFIRFIKMYKYYSGVTKLRIRYIILGTLIGVILAGITNVLMPWFNRFDFLWLGPPLTITWLICIAYGIFKYHLIEINIALTRAGIFVFVYTLVLGIPFWLGYTTKSWFSPTALAVFLATLGPFVYSYLRRRAEDVILRDQRRYQQTLRELSKKMTHIRDLDLLLKTITATIIDTVKVSFAAVYIRDDEYKSYKLRSYYPLNETIMPRSKERDTNKNENLPSFPFVKGGKERDLKVFSSEKTRFQEFVPLDCSLISSLNEEKRPLLSEELRYQNDIDLDSGLVIPCLIEDNLLAFIALGAKPNRQMYTPDDVLVFETFSYSTSLAIENSIFWKEIEERQRQARMQEMNLFSYSLAHEIDNPMHAIIGNSGLLKQFFLKEINIPQEKQQEVEEILGNILECAHRVAGMVEAIQDLGQRTTGEFSPIKLSEVIDSFSKLYEPIFKNEAVHFTKDIPQELPQVKGVKAELMQVLVIFSNNALHALLGSQGKERRIQLKVEIINRQWVRISIIDNGYGISPEKLQTIFAPFITTKASTEGTGMGLYNAKKIVERHKGKIWAESAGKDKGAAFVVELPLAKGLTAADLKEDPLKGKVLFWAEKKEGKDGK